jgi:hypothetical protein
VARVLGRLLAVVPSVCVALYDPVVPAWVHFTCWGVEWVRRRLRWRLEGGEPRELGWMPVSSAR